MKKQGFTLIELMVVIVIMGILAAVAVPKLFGMIAKSKASEVGPAAGTYVKLQDAYVAEKGTTVGSWKQIGYLMQNSSNFVYCGKSSCSTSDNTDGYGSATDITTDAFTGGYWTAYNKATLNDCGVGNNWALSTKANSSTGGTILYDGTIKNTGNFLCAPLTPNFERLITGTKTN